MKEALYIELLGLHVSLYVRQSDGPARSTVCQSFGVKWIHVSALGFNLSALIISGWARKIRLMT
jgi:hypothetical protein